ncbi:MAG: 2-octaprenyl-6-methoxyphenyl hydroxylase [Gammaproteobacteria bacterium]|nr:2-octaprenyl-6-methoxyphenyl hydroxylase [Gammaproteobacteria bacterium]
MSSSQSPERRKAAVDFDVIIVGGGLVGASMACALDGAAVSVAVIERFAPEAPAQPSFDERTIALTWSSRQIFGGLGVWDGIQGEASPIRDIRVSERGHAGSCVLSHRDAGTEALGYVIPTRVLGPALHERMRAADNVTLLCPADVASVKCHPGRVDVQVREAGDDLPRGLTGRLLIMADGGRSTLGEQLGFDSHRKAYPQSALITTVRSDRPHDGRAYERFVGSGPLAMLPMHDRDFAVVWTLEPNSVEALRELADDQLLARLQVAFGEQAGRFTELGSRQIYPLSVSRLGRPRVPRVVAIGNAAHIVHPVAGQGFNLGLKDVADLADQIRDCTQRGDDIGDARAVRRYARSRRRETRNVLSFTDGMIGVFSSGFPPLVVGRNLGLTAIDRLPPLRRALLERTMGLHGRQPRLAAGRPIPSTAAAQRQHYDIVIVGAGLIGGALACLLGNTRFKIAILDRSPPPARPTGEFRLRINAYNRAAERVLRDCGVWEHLPEDRIFPFRRVHCGNVDGDGAIDFAASELGESHLGHFVENELVTAVLMERVAKLENVDVVTDAEIVGVSFEREEAVVHVDGRDAFAARLLVGSDGANSRVRDAAGIGVSRHPYHQRCIVGTIYFDGDLQETAWQRFLHTGPVGLLPLAEGHCSLAWSCHEGHAERLLALDDEAFCAELDEAIQGRLGTITGIGQRASFPLVARDASSYVADRTVLVGDAAHVIHPLAGLGANIGFQDIWALSQVLREVVDDPGADIGAPYRLRRYERRRHRENRLVMSTMSAFNAVFSNDTYLLGRLRDRGMSVANAVAPAKKLLMRRAMWMEMSPVDASSAE